MNRHINFHGKVRRWNHNLTYRNMFSGDIGELRPIYVEDGVPGDTLQYHPEARIYFAPLVFPVLTSMKCCIDLFFVPHRLSWTEFENFITGGPDNNLSPAYPSFRNLYNSLGSGRQSQFRTAFTQAVCPDSNSDCWNSLLNNLGHPVIPDMLMSQAGTALQDDPFDGQLSHDYNLIWDEYYRDEEKQASITAPGGVRMDVYDWFQNSTDAINFQLKRIAWAKDYFTTASLEQQRGGDIPLLSNPMFKFVNGDSFNTSLDNILLGGTTALFDSDNVATPGAIGSTNVDGDTSRLESVLTVNGLARLRAAAAWLNNNVIGGTRYIEQLRSRYRVVSSDARLQRPEMIGRIELPVSIDVVTQTSGATDDENVLADRAGKAQIIASGKTLTYSCEEFGYFIGILHITPKPAYFQGMRRNLQKEDKFDFFMPEFVHVPQRDIRNNEIYCSMDALSPENGGVFGYTGQYNELRHHNDEVHGEFQNTLLAWTMARKFSSLPTADSEAFLTVDSDPDGNNRIFAAPEDGPHIFGVINNIAVFKRELVNREPHF